MNITFFGGAINDTTTIQYKETILIGKFLADNNYNEMTDLLDRKEDKIIIYRKVAEFIK